MWRTSLCIFEMNSGSFFKGRTQWVEAYRSSPSISFSYEIKLLSLDSHAGEAAKTMHHLFVTSERRDAKAISPRTNWWCIGKIQGILACTYNWPYMQANISPHEASMTADGSVESGHPIKKAEKRRLFA